MFEPKAYPDILAGLVAHLRAQNSPLTDFNVGSVTRSWLEAGAIGLDEAWMGLTQAVVEAIPEATYLAFGFARNPAVAALGVVRFSVAEPIGQAIDIPMGFRVAVPGDGPVFATRQAASLPAWGAAVDVPVAAVEAGLAGNVAARRIQRLQDALSAPSSVSVDNPVPTLGGEDQESEAARQARFAQYVRALGRSTVAALDYAARLSCVQDAHGTVIERVRHVAMLERPGYVNLYVHNGVSATSEALALRAAEIIDGHVNPCTGDATPGWRAAGVEVTVSVMADVPLHVKVGTRHTCDGTLDQAALETALADLIYVFAGHFLPVSAITGALHRAAGSTDMVLVDPPSGIAYAPWERPVFGSLTLASA